jgi:cytosol alanyl aminopeptidase
MLLRDLTRWLGRPLSCSVLGYSVLSLGCGARPETPLAAVPVAAAPAEPFDGALALDAAVVPRSYVLDLTLDPTAETFTGTATIVVDVKKATRLLRLHGEGLSFDEVSVSVAGKDAWQPASVSEAKNGGISVALPEALEAGPAELRWRYRAPLPQAPNGVYRARDKDRWYVFTQFEPIEARHAFPCFDQPSFKTPFKVTLRVPDGNTALANAPEISNALDGAWRVFQFAETRPIPTYLVAFAVGPFDIRKAKESGPTEVRIATTQGKGGFADQSLAWTPRILHELTEYFAEPYPFVKLDQVAVPNFSAGAMENVGLVTYRESLLLVDERAPAQDRYSGQSVIAHELSHMWFGNLVTVPWWDDVWLNEAFATWMAPKLVAKVSPEFEAPLSIVSDTQRVMTLDSRRDARSIRQPVREQGDIYNAFDNITYAKGAAVLGMLEAWVGHDPFRSGVQKYMHEHAFGSGTTDDILRSVEEASGKPVTRVARSFLDQPGTPNISFKLDCNQKDDQKSSLTLRQARYLPKGSTAAQGKPWSVPVCFRYGGATAAPRRECVLFEGAEQSFALDSCPVWIVPNADAQGYYRWQLAADRVMALAADGRSVLGPPELIALPSDLGALVESETLPVEDYLTALGNVAAETHPRVLLALLDELDRVYETAIDEPLRAGFASWVRRYLEPHHQRIGNGAAPHEALPVGLLRPVLLRVLTELGQDSKLGALATRKVEGYLHDPTALSSEDLGNYLPIVTLNGNAELWENLRVRLSAVTNPSERRLLVSGLGHFEDEKLVLQSLGLVLDGQLRGQDFRTLVGSMRPRARLAALTWLSAHYQELLERIGEKAAPRLPDLGHGLCTAEARSHLEHTFVSLPNPPSGMDRNLKLVLEEVERCMQRKEYLTPALRQRFGGGH